MREDFKLHLSPKAGGGKMDRIKGEKGEKVFLPEEGKQDYHEELAKRLREVFLPKRTGVPEPTRGAHDQEPT